MPLVQDRSLHLLTSGPARYHCTTDTPTTWFLMIQNKKNLTSVAQVSGLVRHIVSLDVGAAVRDHNGDVIHATPVSTVGCELIVARPPQRFLGVRTATGGPGLQMNASMNECMYVWMDGWSECMNE